MYNEKGKELSIQTRTPERLYMLFIYSTMQKYETINPKMTKIIYYVLRAHESKYTQRWLKNGKDNLPRTAAMILRNVERKSQVTTFLLTGPNTLGRRTSRS